MTEFFLTIVNMSISASWIVLAVLLLRLVLKKAPKWITVALWGIVAVRLICPFSIESALSLIPSAETISPEIMMDATPEIQTGITFINSAVNPVITQSFSPAPLSSANPLQIWIPVASIFWVAGMIVMLFYTAISYWRVKRKIGTAVLLQDNIFQSENVVSPFVLGIIKPKIYLPFQISGQDMAHVIAHENAHIRRKDHWWKPFGFLLLSIHWFNPLMWLGYVLLCRDIELACDEKVIKEMDTEQKADYSQALLTCSVNRRMIAACPLAFGEVSVKNRIKSVLNYKKPAFWIIIFAVILCATVAIGFLTNPVSKSVFDSRFETGKCLYSDVVSEKQETEENDLEFTVTADGVVYKSFDNSHIEQLGALKPTDFTANELKQMLKQQGKTINLGSIKNAYEISDGSLSNVFFKKRNGTVYWVSFFSDGNIMSVFKLKRIGSHNTFSKSLPADLHTFIEEQILEHHRGGYKSGEFSCTDFQVLGTKKEDNCTTVYLWVLYQEYSNDNGLIEDVAGAHIPTVITVRPGFPYELVEYWEPRDGMYYPEDIHSKFPIYLWGRATDSQRYIKKQQEACDAKAAEYFSSVSDSDNPNESENNTENFIISTALSYANWSEGSTIYVGGLNRDKMYMSSVQHLPIYKFDTLQELERFKEHYGQYHTMDQGYNEVPSFNEVTANYNEAFFADHSLILVYVGANNSTHRFGVHGIINNDSVFYVQIRETTGAEAVDSAMAGWFITLAVPDEQIKNCTIFDADLNLYIEEGLPEDEENVTESVIHDPNQIVVYEQIPIDECGRLFDPIYTKMHYLTYDGIWHCEGYDYKYQLEVTGRMNNAATNTTYIVLCNESITFDQAWKAAGFSSNLEDYFDPADAVIVGYRHFSGQIEDDPAETEPPATTPDNGNHSNYKLIVAGRDITQGSNITFQNIIGIFKDMYLPFTAILKGYGAKVYWVSDTVAEITCNGSKYILDLSDQTMVKEGSNGNYIIPAPGSTLYTKTAGKELLIDSLNLRCILKFMGIDTQVSIDHQSKTITIP